MSRAENVGGNVGNGLGRFIGGTVGVGIGLIKGTLGLAFNFKSRVTQFLWAFGMGTAMGMYGVPAIQNDVLPVVKERLGLENVELISSDFSQRSDVHYAVLRTNATPLATIQKLSA